MYAGRASKPDPHPAGFVLPLNPILRAEFGRLLGV